MNVDKIAVLDFGGQYTHLIVNRIRRLGVFSEILNPSCSADSLKVFKGIILSGGPSSVYEKNAPEFNREILDLSCPILGLCYGHQLLAHVFGGRVSKCDIREYGVTKIEIIKDSPLFYGLESEQLVWMSHGDTVSEIPLGFEISAKSKDCLVTAMQNVNKKIFGLQFHPEVTHTKNGTTMLENFLKLCACKKTWNMQNYLEKIIPKIRKMVGNRNIFLLVSGGVDSTVAFALLNKIFGPKRVRGLHIDTGLMRKNETKNIQGFLLKAGFNNLATVDSSEIFLKRLEGVTDPEEKRRIIGDTFIDVQQAEINKMGLDPDKWILGQGTIYPDTIESGGSQYSDKIKTHHNRVEIIQKMLKEGKVIEPLSQLYKDEVRSLGETIGLPEELIWRHPFPGPGLAVRILCNKGTENKNYPEVENQINKIASIRGLEARILPIRSVGVQGDSRSYAHAVTLFGESDWDTLENLSTEITNSFSNINRVTYQMEPQQAFAFKIKKTHLSKERLALLREADFIIHEYIKEKGFHMEIWQCPVVLLPLSHDGDKETIVIRPVHSQEAMTASFYKLPMESVRELARNIMEKLPLEAFLYDITNKPPATIEWE